MTTRCRTCGKAGGHYPSCSKLKPRPCRGCGVELGHDDGSNRTYCDRCRETVCPECLSYGGHHNVQCLWIHRARRRLRAHYQGLGPTKMPYQGVVSREDIRALYETHREGAVRFAHSLGANGDSEDLVQDVTLYLIERQDYLSQPPSKAYLFTAVRHAVMNRFQTSYVQRTVLADTQELVDIEEMQYAFEHGRPRTLDAWRLDDQEERPAPGRDGGSR